MTSTRCPSIMSPTRIVRSPVVASASTVAVATPSHSAAGSATRATRAGTPRRTATRSRKFCATHREQPAQAVTERDGNGVNRRHVVVEPAALIGESAQQARVVVDAVAKREDAHSLAAAAASAASSQRGERPVAQLRAHEREHFVGIDDAMVCVAICQEKQRGAAARRLAFGWLAARRCASEDLKTFENATG